HDMLSAGFLPKHTASNPMHPVFVARSKSAQPIWFVTPATFSKVTAALDKRARAFIKASGFEPRPGRHLIVPAAQGVAVLFGLDGKAGHNAFLPGLLPGVLPAGTYRFANAPHEPRLAALAFALGAYRFARYRKGDAKVVRLALPDDIDAADLAR